MVVHDNWLELSNGTRIYNAGWPVLSFDFKERLVFGYDGQSDVRDWSNHNAELTGEEKQEIALYMMQRWADWAGGGFDIKINEIF